MDLSPHGGMSRRRKVVVALGGNALLQRHEKMTLDNQAQNIRAAVASLSELILEDVETSWCITHGNGPQVGLLAEQANEFPLDVLGAESQGQIGYMLEMELRNRLQHHGVTCVTILTTTVVDENDEALRNPTKFVGPMYSPQEAERIGREHNWEMRQDGNRGLRRVVPSPRPKHIQQAAAIQALLGSRHVVICCGGGGVPVYEKRDEGDGQLEYVGMEAVIDKDAASALVAKLLQADALLLLTDVDAVYDPAQWPDKHVPVPSPIKAEDLDLAKLAPGSMQPKVQAAKEFAMETGGVACIGSVHAAAAVLRGDAGTHIVGGKRAK